MNNPINLQRILIILTAASIVLVSSFAIAQEMEGNGFRKEYYDNGKLLSETNCLQEDSTGVYREYYENENLKMEVHYKAGQLHGPYADYCEDGSPHVQFEYKNNSRDGEYTLYYDNGELQAKGIYVNGKEQGLHQVFYPNGQLSAEVNYIDGNETGVAKTYYKDGSLWEEFSYKEGVRDGEYREYTPENILKKEINYKDGDVLYARDYDDERKVILEVMEEKFVKSDKSSENRHLSGLHRCVSDEVGITFACNPHWKLRRIGKFLEITVSEVPLVILMVEETDQKVHFMHELSREALADMNRYEDDFHIERFSHCDRETVKVNGYLKDRSEARVSDYYLLDHLHLHSVKFTVEPKKAWEEYKWLIKEIVDSLAFIKHKTDVKFVMEEMDETCEELIKE